jgi:DNA-binding NarL/FixJ family response regulator
VPDVIEVLEAACALDGTEEEWLRRVTEAVASHLDRGRGVVSFFYDACTDLRMWGFTGSGPDLEVVPMSTTLEIGKQTAFLDRTFRRPLLLAYTADAVGPEMFVDLHRQLLDVGLADSVPDVLMLKTNGVLPQGCAFGASDLRPARVPVGQRHLLERVALHIGAGLRLRRALGETGGREGGEAVFLPDGRCADATGTARGARARDALRSAVKSMDRARGALRRRAADEALELWRCMVEGRWTLVDRFEADGKRFIVAHPNQDNGAPLRALTDREQQVATQAALGRSNKLIAYDLGLASGTVARLVSDACRKLGVRSRTELPTLAAPLGLSWMRLGAGPEEAQVAVGVASQRGGAEFPALTQGEGEIVTCVVAGNTNAEIASKRGVAPRTVANQLATIYRKLGVQSRNELAAMVAKAHAGSCEDA